MLVSNLFLIALLDCPSPSAFIMNSRPEGKKARFWVWARHRAETKLTCCKSIHLQPKLYVYVLWQFFWLSACASAVVLWGISLRGEPPFIGKEQKQSAAAAGSFALLLLSAPLHTKAHKKQTSRDISCIFTQTNSPEGPEAPQGWPIKYTRPFFCYISIMEGQRHGRRWGCGGGETLSPAALIWNHSLNLCTNVETVAT